MGWGLGEALEFFLRVFRIFGGFSAFSIYKGFLGLLKCGFVGGAFKQFGLLKRF